MSQQAPGTTAASLSDKAKYVWHPMTSPKLSESDPPLIVASGSGVHITDVDGNKYLDCTAGLWNVNIGHNRPEVNKAISDQLSRIAYHSNFVGTTNPPSIELAAKLVELLEPEHAARVFFSNSGSDANETSFKLARQYWKLQGRAAKTKILSLKDGYHGTHFGTMSASGNSIYRWAYGPAVPDFHQVESPNLYRNPFTDDPEELGEICANLLEHEIQYYGPDTIAAFVAEPVQGAGGVNVPPPNYWPLIRAVCDRNEVLLIADEVITGFGRSGSLFGSRGWGVKPDIMNLAKGINSGYIPLGATVLNERIADAWNSDQLLSLVMHGYTTTGHPVACAAALANIEIVLKEDLAGNAAIQGAYFLSRLQNELHEYKSVGDVRGKGLMICVEMVMDKQSKEPFPPGHEFPTAVFKECRKNGVLVRPIAHKFIISPPLTFGKENVDQAVDIIRNAFRKFDRR